MGNSESSSQFPPPSNNDDGNNDKKTSYWDQAKKALTEDDDEGSTSSALKIGAAVAGTALLAFGAYSRASAASSQSDDGDNSRRRATQMENLVIEGARSRSCQIPNPSSHPGGGLHGEAGDRVHLQGAQHFRISYGEHGDSGSNHTMLKILSYNVWFREDLELHKRMEAIGDLILQHLPDIICFQEVTPNIYENFQNSDWWGMYKCSLSKEMAIIRPYFCMQMSKLPVRAFRRKPFDNSRMGRELCVAEVDVGVDKKLVVATSHLESPCPGPPKWDQMFSKERIIQAKESIGILNDHPNVIFCGDMNWDDKLDGAFPLNYGWVDAWTELRPGDNGWTYDTKSNQMLSGNRTLQKRLDRFVCKLSDLKIDSIEMIGKEGIPGLFYCKEKKVRGEAMKLQLPVLPSDHYGLLLTIRSL